MGLMENIYKEIYDFVKKNGAAMAATELSMIVHMGDKLTKEEIIVRCTAIRNALWDLESEDANRK